MSLTFVFTFVVTFLVSSLGQSGEFVRYYLADVNPLAICNDNTSAVYYFREGYDNGIDKWVIRQQGGGWCWDEQSCQSRQKNSPYWTSTSQCPKYLNDSTTIDGVKHEGILSSNKSENPIFYNANQVYLWYCSSDSHLGNATSPWGWNHRGKVITQTLINDLHSKHSDLLSNAQLILVTGDSAGGVGALNNVDYISNMFFEKKVIPDNTRIVGFIDAGWFLDIPTYNPSSTAFRYVASNMTYYYNMKWNKDCINNYMSSNETWKCFHAQYMVQFINTSLIYHQFLYDSANLNFDGIGHINESNTQQMEYIQNFRSTLVHWMDDIRNVSFYFRPACYEHEVEDGNNGGIVHNYINSINFTYAMSKWLSNSNEFKASDECQSFDCNQYCIN